MKEAFFILLVVVVILVLTAIRYRKQIVTMMHVWRSLKLMREQMKGKQVGPVENISSGKLINCAKCGTWVPEQRALKLRDGTFYCSSSCLETTAMAR
jgi:hypothetical protein